jgi:hypothetical protein
MNNIKEVNTVNNNKGNGYKIVVILLLVVMVALGYLFFSQQQKTEQKIAELNQISQEKESLTMQYQGLLDDYNSLETTSDSVAMQLDAEKERIKALIEDLHKTKANNRYQINKYKKELKTLRKVMKSFIHQVDSLNTLNIELTAENKEIKHQYQTARKNNKKLAEKYDEALSKVKEASVIKAIGINVNALNKKGKPTHRAKKTKRFSIAFSLDENVIAPKGTKSIYLRITDPEDHILIQNNQPVFSYEGEKIAYSSVRKVEYDGSVSDAVVYFEHQGEDALIEGVYSVDIFCDGSMIGSSTIELN